MTTDMFPGEARTEDPNRRYTDAKFMAWIKMTADVAAWDVDVAIAIIQDVRFRPAKRGVFAR